MALRPVRLSGIIELLFHISKQLLRNIRLRISDQGILNIRFVSNIRDIIIY